MLNSKIFYWNHQLSHTAEDKIDALILPFQFCVLILSYLWILPVAWLYGGTFWLVQLSLLTLISWCGLLGLRSGMTQTKTLIVYGTLVLPVFFILQYIFIWPILKRYPYYNKNKVENFFRVDYE